MNVCIYLPTILDLLSIKTKANRSLGLIKYAKKYLPTDVLNKMYRGIVEPRLSNCSSVWGCCGDSRISVLQEIQNRATRIVTNNSCDASAASLIQNLGWSAVRKLVKKRLPCYLQVSELTCPWLPEKIIYKMFR